VFCERPVDSADLLIEERGHGDEEDGCANGERAFEDGAIPKLASNDVREDDDEEYEPEGPVGVDELDERDGLDLAEVAREVEVLWQVAVEEELEADVVEGHDFVQAPVAEECARVWEPPLGVSPPDACVEVDAVAEPPKLLLHLEVSDDVHLLHALPAARQGEGRGGRDEDDGGVDDGEREDEDVGKLEGRDGGRGWLGDGGVEDEDEGDEAEDHELAVEVAQHGLEVDVRQGDPAL
jgi:hypothetical protein